MYIKPVFKGLISLYAENILCLKGYFGFFEVELSEVLTHSQCITYSRGRLARSLFGEPAKVPAQKLSYVPL